MKIKLIALEVRGQTLTLYRLGETLVASTADGKVEGFPERLGTPFEIATAIFDKLLKRQAQLTELDALSGIVDGIMSDDITVF